MFPNLRVSGFCGVLTVALMCVGAAKTAAETVTVFAAASLQDVVTDAAALFERQTGHAVTPVFAGSSALARQIEYGAPADIVLLANVDWMKHLANKGLVLPDHVESFFGNALSIIVPADFAPGQHSEDSVDLLKIVKDGRVAMALVDAVPAGIYGRAALQSLGLWESIAPQVVQVDNVRAALALVALREANAGVVYVTDARADARVKTVHQFAEGTHAPIVYPAAIVTGKDRPEVRAFMNFLGQDVARNLFVSHGFKPLDADQ